MTNDALLETSAEYLRRLMALYRTDHLVNVDRVSFRRQIEAFLAWDDAASEGYLDPALQRDLSVKFHWGHNHDFGEFALAGRMRDRHVWVLSVFMDELQALPRDLHGTRVLDIGCWTGGTSLLLAAMGAEVNAIEEVRKYVAAVRYLKHAFDIRRLEVRHQSLYDLTAPDVQDVFDFALFAGVIYHVTDPVLALRHVFNSLRDGGVCLLETMGCSSDQTILEYHGPSTITGGTAEDRNRRGWNWFVPSASAVSRMMQDVGFTDVALGPIVNGRIFAVGRRAGHVDMLRAGLSVRDVR
jgi:2-polyprenyl-3-methyl-5-hydroxy-6-metoxy-1,4-benzoquinol methylase